MVGSGVFAGEYMKAARYIRSAYHVELRIQAACNRTEESNLRARELYGIDSTYFEPREMIEREKPDCLFVLVPPDRMYETVLKLLPYRVPLLIEKPPGLTSAQTMHLAAEAERDGTSVMVGFNRRFYSVAKQAKKFVEDAGGLLGMRMDAFERYKIYKENKVLPDEQLEALFMTNSIHCIDLIRFYAGESTAVTSFSNAGAMGSFAHRYSSLVVSDRNVPVTFQAYWNSVGNWNYELYFEDGKIQFVTLEEAYLHRRGEHPVKIEPQQDDIEAKPGLTRQLLYFMEHVAPTMNYCGELSLRDAARTMRLAEQLTGTTIGGESHERID